MPNRIAKRKAKLDRVVAGNEVFHNIYNVEYHETSKYKYRKRKMWNDVSIAKDDVVKRANSAGGWRS
jgi:hypothetical protein